MDFSITSILNKQDYIKIMFIGLYKKPIFIIMAIFGTLLLTSVILNQLRIIEFQVYGTAYDLACGVFMILSPSLIVLLSVSQLNSNPSFLKQMTYTFSDESLQVHGATFKSEVAWSHIIKQKEIGNFLILYHTKKFGNFIDKSHLTLEQLQFIKSKTPKK